MQYAQKLTFLLLFVGIVKIANAQSTQEKTRISGFVDFNVYYDTREFSVLTYNILANISERLQYFSLTNYQSAERSFDMGSSYAEHNLRWKIKKKTPLDLTFQYVLRNGVDNDDFRFGIRWRLNNTPKIDSFLKKLNMSYSFNPMFIEFSRREAAKFMTIIEHVYKINIAPKALNNRLYIGGFIDQNFEYPNTGGILFNWVSEHQLGVRLFDEFYAVLEYRINDFLPADNYGLGYGIEYNIIF